MAFTWVRLFLIVRSLALFVGLLFTSVAYASSYYASVEKISVGQGLPDTTVYSLAKDDYGFLWLGTPTGLARYDGYQFRVFSKANGSTEPVFMPKEVLDDSAKGPIALDQLATTSAANIFIDSKQRIWVGTWGEGVLIYDNNMQLLGHHVFDDQNPHSIGNNKVQTIFEDADGDIWIGTNGGGLGLYREQSEDFLNLQHDIGNTKSISHNRVWGVTQTDDGILWIATSDGLNRLDKSNLNEFRRFRHNPFDKRTVNHVLVRVVHAVGQQLWIGTEMGFGYFDTERMEFNEIPLFDGKSSAAITNIMSDSQGGIWVGTQKGLFRYEYENQRLTPLADKQNVRLFPHNDIRDLLLDEAGILWVATRYSGVLKINLTSNNFSFYQNYTGNGRNDNAINKVYALHADKANNMWIGMDDGLLRMDLETRKITRFNPGAFFSDMTINAITETDDGTIWIGGPSGLASLNVDRAQFVDQMVLLANLSIKKVLSLLYDSKGNLWIGTSTEGLLRYDKQGKLTWFKYDESDDKSISGNSILTIFEDDLNRIWVGTSGNGASRYDAAHQNFVRYSANSRDVDSLNINVVETIYQTRDSVMWFGTPKFLSALDDSSGKFQHYSELDGLASSNIKGLLEDKRGDLWISTVKGLTQYKRSEDHFFNYSDKDSLNSNEFIRQAVTVDKQGHLYFGNTSGFHEVQPDEVKINRHIPQTVITQVWVDNKLVPRYRFDKSKPLVLTNEAKTIRIEFSALDFLAPNKNLYQHRLNGFDDTWTEPDTQRNVTFTSLNPGSYNFEVKGSNNSNQWSVDGTSLEIIVTMPWWRLWYVVVTVCVLGSLLIYSFYRSRVRFMAEQKSRLEALVEERTKELLQQTDELVIAHEQLNEHSDALAQTNAELSQTLERTAQYQDELVEKEKMAALGKMVAGIAHEINTPIGLGVTATSLMMDRMKTLEQAFASKKLSPTQLKKYIQEGSESLDMIYRNLERAAELISSFKQVSVDQSSDESRRFDMAQLIDEVLLSLRPNLKKVKHQVEVNCKGQVIVRSKPGALSQILINFINNSLIHAFDEVEQGLMSIDVHIEGQYCHLTYKDNGGGVSPDIEAQIFEPFATTKRGEGGSGLGMHLVYNLATQALGGSIHMVNKPGEGIEFQVVFPITDERAKKHIENKARN